MGIEARQYEFPGWEKPEDVEKAVEVASAPPRKARGWMRLLAEVFTKALIVPEPDGWGLTELVQGHKAEIVGQRMMLVMKAMRQAEEDQKAPALPMTWWELIHLISAASMEGPLGSTAVEVQKWCFAHCYGLDRYIEICGHELIRTYAIREFQDRRFRGIKERCPPLDDEEREWIEDFNRILMMRRMGRI